MHRGYIYLWRCISDNIFWQEKPFDRGRAWIDLLMLANHEDSVLWKRGIKIEVKRGQVGWSERQLSERWGWSRTKIQKFLRELKTEHQIEPQKEPQKNNITSLITITNYEQYQNKKPQKEPQKEPQKSHRKATEDTRENTFKNEKNKTSCDGFDNFWNIYPRKIGKGAAQKSWERISPDSELQGNISRAVELQKQCDQWKRNNGQFIPHPATWLNQQRWFDETTGEDDSWKII